MSKNGERYIKYRIIRHKIFHPIRAYKIHKVIKILKNNDIWQKLDENGRQ
jgi:hypothetical protein